MTIGEELLAAVRRSPDDRAARRVYGDWLLEQGDPRGELVALHCELEETSERDARYPALLAAARRAEARHPPSWLRELLARDDPDGSDDPRWQAIERRGAVFRGGFLHRIAMRPASLARDWAWLREREPVQGVELLVGEHVPEEVRSLPEARSFRTLKVTPEGWFYVNSVGDVLRWGLDELRELDLSGCDLGADGARLLVGLETDLAASFEGWSPPPPLRLEQLERLALRGTQLGDEGARVLLGARALEGLVELDVSQCRLADPETLAALGRSPLPRLRRLALAGNNALGGNLVALSGSPILGSLEALTLPQTTTEGDLAALFPAPSPALRALDLSSARALLRAPGAVSRVAEALTRLDVGTTSLGDDGLRALLEAPATAGLVELRANGCSLGDEAVRALVRSPLERLVTLDLSSNKLTDAGLAELAAWPGLRHVTHLRLGNNRKLGAKGLEALAASGVELVELDVGKASDAVAGLARERFGRAARVRS